MTTAVTANGPCRSARLRPASWCPARTSRGQTRWPRARAEDSRGRPAGFQPALASAARSARHGRPPCPSRRGCGRRAPGRPTSRGATRRGTPRQRTPSAPSPGRPMRASPPGRRRRSFTPTIRSSSRWPKPRSGRSGAGPAAPQSTRSSPTGSGQWSTRTGSARSTTFSRVVERAPTFAEGWNKRATARFLATHYATSIADCQEVVRLNPHHFGALAGQGLCHVALGQLREAARCFRQRAPGPSPARGGPAASRPDRDDAGARQRPRDRRQPRPTRGAPR